MGICKQQIYEGTGLLVYISSSPVPGESKAMKKDPVSRYLSIISVSLFLMTAGSQAHAMLPGAFGRMEAEALKKIDAMDVGALEKARLRREATGALKQAAQEHQAAMEALKRAQAYADAGGAAPESFKRYLNTSGKVLGMMGDGALVTDTLSQMDQLGDDGYLPEEAKATAQALTALGGVMQKAGDQLNKILPGMGDAITGYGQISQKLAGMTSEISRARTKQVEGYFQNVRGGSPEDRLMNRVGADGLARHLELWDKGIPVARADMGQGEDRYFLRVGDTYEEVKDLGELQKIVGDWRITHHGTNPDAMVLRTLLNGGKVEEKYVTWDREELHWTARAKVEVAVQDGILRKSLGDAEFDKLSSEERRDLRDQLHVFEREIENLGGVVDDDRLARLFNNAVIQGNRDRVLKGIVYEQDPEGFDTALEHKGMTLEDAPGPYDLQAVIAPADGSAQGAGGEGAVQGAQLEDGGAGNTGGRGGFSFFQNLKEKGTTGNAPAESGDEAWEPRSYVLLRNETKEFQERKKSLKDRLSQQIQKVKDQITRNRRELDRKIDRTKEVQRRSISREYSWSYDPGELEYKGKTYKDRLDILEAQRREKLAKNESVFQLRQIVTQTYQDLASGPAATIKRKGPFQVEGSFTRYFATQEEPGVIRVTSFYVNRDVPSSMSTRFYRVNTLDMGPEEFLGFLTTPGMDPHDIGNDDYIIDDEGRLVRRGRDYRSERFFDQVVDIEITTPAVLAEKEAEDRAVNGAYDRLIGYNRDVRQRELEEIRNDFAIREMELQDQLAVLEDRLAVMDGDSESAQEDRYYSTSRLKDPNVKELVDIMDEFDAIRDIDKNPAITVTVNTKEEWDKVFAKPALGADQAMDGMESPAFDTEKELASSDQQAGQEQGRQQGGHQP